MSRPISLQVHVSNDLAVRVRAAARRREISVSEWIRSLLSQACDDDDYVSRLEHSVNRIARHSVFLMVGVDALLLVKERADLVVRHCPSISTKR